MAKRGTLLGNWKAQIKKKEKGALLLCILLATGAGILCMFAMMALFALVLSSFPLPLAVFQPAGLMIGVLAAAASGLCCSLLNREKGFLFGILCGAILFLILLLTAMLAWQQHISAQSFVKLSAMLLAGAIGGMIGVNLT